jgi:hypothetical protein
MDMDIFIDRMIELWPILLPVILVELGFRVYALYDILKKNRLTNAFPKWFWTLVVATVSFGWIFYLLAGRSDE